MKKEADEILSWLKAIENYDLPTYDQLPRVPLYMEQVIEYLNDIFKDLSTSDKDKLTSFMVNNYVKAGIIDAPVNKKYGVDHLGYLIAITSLKSTLSISDIALLIEMDGDVSPDKSILYRFFRGMRIDILQNYAINLRKKLEVYLQKYDNDVAKNDEHCEDNLRDSLGLIALRMSIQAGVYQMLAKTILTKIGEEKNGEAFHELKNRGEREKRREEENDSAEAERIHKARKKKKVSKQKPAKKDKKEEE
ncbi:MAG: DUF1836 domain-containing protein [Bacilli bacterium]|nr:DUF1836 domain-containing protein [Bacilli bacterium]